MKPLFALCQEWRDEHASGINEQTTTFDAYDAFTFCADALEVALKEWAAEISKPEIRNLAQVIQQQILGVSPEGGTAQPPAGQERES